MNAGRVVSVAALVLLGVVAAPVAGASDRDGVQFDAALLDDAAVIAKERGLSAEEAAARVAWQDGFAIAATAVEEAFPEAFSQAAITSELPPVATIEFKGEVPDGVEKFLAGVSPTVRVELIGGEEFNAQEVDEQVIRVHRALWESGALSELVSSFDRQSGQVVATGKPVEKLGESELQQAAQDIVSRLPVESRKTSLTLVNEPRAVDDARRGGGRLEQDGSSALSCTSGFNVVNSSGVTGVATAGHCPNGLTHENATGETEWDLTYKAQHRGEWGDFQWHTSTDTEPDNFIPYAGEVRDVTGRANPVLDQSLCRYGLNTGQECDTVADLSLCVTVDDVEACHLVRMDHGEAGGGDSGGPWYSGNTAYGFHKGSTSCGFLWLNSCDVWSRATYIDDALGVTVRD